MVKKIKRKVNGKLLIYALAISLSLPFFIWDGWRESGWSGMLACQRLPAINIVCLPTSVFRHFSIFLEQQQSKNWRRWFIVEINNQFLFSSISCHHLSFTAPVVFYIFMFLRPPFCRSEIFKSVDFNCWNVSNFITNRFVYLQRCSSVVG